MTTTKITPLYIIHLIILLGIISVPVWPLKLLKFGVFIPFGISLIWLIFDGCPISFMQDELEGKSIFTYDVLKRIMPNITEKQTENFLTAYLIFATLVSSYRLKMNQ